MDMRHLTFADKSFNGLHVAYSLIHIPSNEIPQMLEGFRRVLKLEGYIKIIAQKGESDQVVSEPFMPTEKMFYNFFTKERLNKFLLKVGFLVVYQTEGATKDSNAGSNLVIYTIAQKPNR